jgi:hypothetical protein
MLQEANDRLPGVILSLQSNQNVKSKGQILLSKLEKVQSKNEHIPSLVD